MDLRVRMLDVLVLPHMDINIVHIVGKSGDKRHIESGTHFASIAVHVLGFKRSLTNLEHMLPFLSVTVLVPDCEVITNLYVLVNHGTIFSRHEESADIEELVHG